MKTKNLFALKSILLVAASALMFSAYSHADGKDKHHKVKTLKGCYQVVKGSMEESAADAEQVIGTYHFVLSQEGRSKRKNVVISGPIGGSEGVGAHEEEEEHEEGAEEEGEIHGGHVLGTFNRIGTLSSNEDDFVPTGAECFGDDGQPRLVTGVETLQFNKGTGVFLGLTHGSIVFDVTFDACTDATNPVADLKATTGELCFQE
ncbi:MAG: hypothetical protein Q7T48_10480 [Cellvibrio sp.]|uniref:hypothetical protein n=1 Tax=Cellvibrio sp. TaxID=1965322 RepID=UPI0027218193|nr:hypothetical protein [Cellvibrio sp.]